MRTAVLIMTMSLVTILLRFLPFLVFRKKIPSYIVYLGQVLPAAIIGMLVIYCLKDVSLAGGAFALPELAACAVVVAVQILRRNSLLSILAGTAVYMILL